MPMRSQPCLGDSVTVRAPATSGNLGCGFDTFGIALNLWLTLTVTVAINFSFTIDGIVGEDSEIPFDGTNVIVRAFLLGLNYLKIPHRNIEFAFICRNEIPLARGLGSSAAAIVAGLGAAFAFANDDLDNPGVLQELAALSCSYEGHPDNVVPAVFGAMQIAIIQKGGSKTFPHAFPKEFTGSTPICQLIRTAIPFPSDDIGVVVHLPSRPLRTSHSRGVLPAMTSLENATQNIGRAATLIACLLKRDYEHLEQALLDSLHEPYRQSMCPTLEAIRRVLPKTPAYSAYLSGAGPSIVIWCHPRDAVRVQEMLNLLAPELRSSGTFLSLNVTPSGLHLLSRDISEFSTPQHSTAGSSSTPSTTSTLARL